MVSDGLSDTAMEVRQAVVLLLGHGREAAGLETQIDDLAQGDSGTDPLGIEAVHLQVAVVADHQPLCAVEEAQALRHVVDGQVELQVAPAQLLFLLEGSLMLLFQAGMQLFALGDVVVGGDPSPARQDAVGDGDEAAVVEARNFAPRRRPLQRGIQVDHIVVGRRPLGKRALREAMVQQLEKPGPWLRLLRRQIVHLQIACIAHDQAMFGIEHAQPLGHIVQGHVEARILPAQLFLALLEQRVLLQQPRVELLAVAGGAARRIALPRCGRDAPGNVAKSRRCLAFPRPHGYRSKCDLV